MSYPMVQILEIKNKSNTNNISTESLQIKVAKIIQPQSTIVLMHLEPRLKDLFELWSREGPQLQEY